MNQLLNIEHLNKYYGSKTVVYKALDDVSFNVSKGEYVSIMGASGSGKTTLLNCISTIDNATSGHIFLDGVDITAIKDKELAKFRQQNIGFIFQDYNLLDTLTLEENIALAPVISKVNKDEIDDKVIKIADKLNIFNVLKKFPYEVSGGEKQRCACARAIINNPKLILADEPTGALDSKSAQMLLNTFTKLNKEMNATIIMVTHDVFSSSYSNRVLFLKDGKIFNEIYKGDKTRKEFFNEILDVVTFLGGDVSDAR